MWFYLCFYLMNDQFLIQERPLYLDFISLCMNLLPEPESYNGKQDIKLNLQLFVVILFINNSN